MRYASLCAVLAFSCVGTEIGNPPTSDQTTTVSVDLIGVEEAPQPVIPIGLTLANGVEVDRAALLVGELRFRQLETCNEASVDHADAFLAELLEPQVEVNDIELPSGRYCRVDIRPRRGGEDGFLSEQPELEGLTLYAVGTFESTPFEIRYESDDELSFVGEFELLPGNQTIFIAVDIPAWFDGVDLSAADTNADGVAVIGEESNTSIYEQFADNYERSVSVALDANGDQTLTPEDYEEETEDGR